MTHGVVQEPVVQRRTNPARQELKTLGKPRPTLGHGTGTQDTAGSGASGNGVKMVGSLDSGTVPSLSRTTLIHLLGLVGVIDVSGLWLSEGGTKQTDVPMYRRAEKVLRSLGWDLQVDMEHLSDEVLGSSLYLEAIIEVLNNKAGVREDDDRRRAYRAAISDSQRHKDETLAQFAVRRQ